jgi:hypothetical protein
VKAAANLHEETAERKWKDENYSGESLRFLLCGGLS